MKQQHKAKAPEDEVEVEVAGSPVRCPYCHDTCTAEDTRAIVCQKCLSRHHGACWREGQHRCASCGSRKALKESAPVLRVAPAELELVRRGLPREAVDKLQRRYQGIEEADALRALLEAAARELSERALPLPAWAIVAIMALLIPILAILVNA